MLNRYNYLKQSKEIQNIIKKYWCPVKFNTFCLKENNKFLYIINMVDDNMISTSMCNSEVWYNIYDENVIPLLSSIQVEVIIERITNTKSFSTIDRTGRPLIRLFDVIDGNIILKETYYGKQSNDSFYQTVNKINLLWEVLINVIKKEEI